MFMIYQNTEALIYNKSTSVGFPHSLSIYISGTSYTCSSLRKPLTWRGATEI